MDSVTSILWAQYNIRAKALDKINCPFYGKHTFQIIDNDTIGKCFHPDCEKFIEVKKAEGVASSPKNRTTLQAVECTMAAYSKAKKLPEEFFKSLGVKEINFHEKKALKIPYYDEDKNEKSVRHRIELTKRDIDNRFRWKKVQSHFYTDCGA